MAKVGLTRQSQKFFSAAARIRACEKLCLQFALEMHSGDGDDETKGDTVPIRRLLQSTIPKQPRELVFFSLDFHHATLHLLEKYL